MLVEIAAGFVVANIYEDILLVLVGAVFQLSSCLWVCLLSVVGVGCEVAINRYRW